MQLRFFHTLDRGTTIVRVDGRLARDGVAELNRLCEGAAGPLRLVLSNLKSVDGSGVDALRSLAGRGVDLVGVPRFIDLLLARPKRRTP